MTDQVNLKVGATTVVHVALHISVIDPADVDEVVLQLRLVVELVTHSVPGAEEVEVLITARTCTGRPGIDLGQIDMIGALYKVGDHVTARIRGARIVDRTEHENI